MIDLRLKAIEVGERGVTLVWGVMGNEIISVRIVGDDVLARVRELIRKEVIDEVVKESITCVQDLSECAKRVPQGRDRAWLYDKIRELIVMSEEDCIKHDEIMEFAADAGYGADDAEAVIKELVEDGEIEDNGGCYSLPDEEPPLDP